MVVLCGNGGHFCAGGSLGGFASSIGSPLPAGAQDPLVQVNREFGQLLQQLAELPQLLIAAVQGRPWAAVWGWSAWPTGW